MHDYSKYLTTILLSTTQKQNVKAYAWFGTGGRGLSENKRVGAFPHAGKLGRAVRHRLLGIRFGGGKGGRDEAIENGGIAQYSV